MDKKEQNFFYPIEVLGGEYIHSNQIHFVRTYQENSAFKEMENILIMLKSKLKAYVKEEMKFYEAAEKAYIEQVKKNVEGSPLANKLKGRVSILKHINKVREKEMKNQQSALGQLVASKDQIQLWQMQWYKKWFKQTKGEEDLDTAQFTRYAKMIPQIIEGLLAAVEIIRLEKEKENMGIFGTYETVQLDSEIKTKKQLKADMSKSLKTILGSEEKIIELETLAKDITQTSMKEILIKLVDIMGDVYVTIQQKFGLLAEDFETNFINENMKFLTFEQNAKVVGAAFKGFQVMDVQLMKISVKKVKNVSIGFSEKFTKYMKFTKGYTNIDIFDTLASYAKAKSENELLNTIEKNKDFIGYLRRNILALSTFNLGNKVLDDILDPYIKIEKELALIRGFTRFFNQYLMLSEEGELSPFKKSNKENIIGYNALIVFKQKVYWMKDFIELAYNSIDSNIIDGEWKGQIFTGETKLKKLKVQKRSQLAALWNKKLKILREFEKEMKSVSYKKLLEGSREEIGKVFSGKGKFPKLVESMSYTLDASKFKKGAKN